MGIAEWMIYKWTAQNQDMLVIRTPLCSQDSLKSGHLFIPIFCSIPMRNFHPQNQVSFLSPYIPQKWCPCLEFQRSGKMTASQQERTSTYSGVKKNGGRGRLKIVNIRKMKKGQLYHIFSSHNLDLSYNPSVGRQLPQNANQWSSMLSRRRWVASTKDPSSYLCGRFWILPPNLGLYQCKQGLVADLELKTTNYSWRACKYPPAKIWMPAGGGYMDWPFDNFEDTCSDQRSCL